MHFQIDAEASAPAMHASAGILDDAYAIQLQHATIKHLGSLSNGISQATEFALMIAKLQSKFDPDYLVLST